MRVASEVGDKFQPSWNLPVSALYALTAPSTPEPARAELTPAQEAAHIRRKQEIWEMIHGSSETNCSTLPTTGRGNKQFAAELAEVIGASKVDINRKLRRVNELGSDINLIVGTSLDKGVEKAAARLQFLALYQ